MVSMLRRLLHRMTADLFFRKTGQVHLIPEVVDLRHCKRAIVLPEPSGIVAKSGERAAGCLFAIHGTQRDGSNAELYFGLRNRDAMAFVDQIMRAINESETMGAKQ